MSGRGRAGVAAARAAAGGARGPHAVRGSPARSPPPPRPRLGLAPAAPQASLAPARARRGPRAPPPSRRVWPSSALQDPSPPRPRPPQPGTKSPQSPGWMSRCKVPGCPELFPNCIIAARGVRTGEDPPGSTGWVCA